MNTCISRHRIWYMHSQFRTHSHSHALTHIYPLTHMHPLTLTSSHTRTYSTNFCSLALARTYTLSRSDTRTHSQIHPLTLARWRNRKYTFLHAHAQIHAYTKLCTWPHNRMYTHAHIHIKTHSHRWAPIIGPVTALRGVSIAPVLSIFIGRISTVFPTFSNIFNHRYKNKQILIHYIILIH